MLNKIKIPESCSRNLQGGSMNVSFIEAYFHNDISIDKIQGKFEREESHYGKVELHP